MQGKYLQKTARISFTVRAFKIVTGRRTAGVRVSSLPRVFIDTRHRHFRFEERA